MKLLVVSHTPHYLAGETIVGWGPTVREIDRLADLFGEVRHVAPLHDEPAPASALPYEGGKVQFVAVRPTGGHGFASKLGVLAAWPVYFQRIRRELQWCDVAHVRCPSNIGLLATIILAMARNPRVRWIKYAGNWRPGSSEPWSYAFQRWLLGRPLLRAQVTVAGAWPDLPAHVHPFFNPCLTPEELAEGKRKGAGKVLGSSPVRLVFVGTLDEAKGCGRAIEIAAALRDRGPGIRLCVVGDGPGRSAMESRAARLGLGQLVQFVGWLPRTRLGEFYGDAHFLLLPSRTEGWPKVVSEAMAYGVVPLTSDVGSLPGYLREFRTGRAFDALDREGFVEAVAQYEKDPDRWKAESRNAMEAAALFSYGRYLVAVRSLLNLEAA